MHKVVYNSETIWDRDKAKIDAQITMFIDDVYWFGISMMNISGDYVKSILP